MKVAALDLGTNSFLCLIAEVAQGQIQNILSDEVQIVRLGQDVQKNKAFHPEALKRARACLTDFKKTIDQFPVEKILAMATSAARDVSNAEELFQIGKDLGIPIEVIPGSREVEITFNGSISGMPRDGKIRAVIDIGGGSTEIIVGTHDELLGGSSVNVGAVRLTEMFFPNQPPEQAEVQSFLLYMKQQLAPVLETVRKFRISELIAVAGTPTELAAAAIGGFDAKQIDGYQLTQPRLQKWVDDLMKTKTEERIQQLRISKGRADIILAGTLILKTILEELKFESVTVSTRGVRYGIALELEKQT